MNNRNWIAVFLGLACLVLFVSVMGASGNWLNNNSTNNSGMVNPQQVSQTVRGMNEVPNQNVPTKIDASNLVSDITGGGNMKPGVAAAGTASSSSSSSSNMLQMPQINMP